MAFNSLPSFVNGIIAGAGAVLAIMSVAFVEMVKPLEGVMGFTSTEIRVAILLGGIVCAVAIGYEFYSKNDTKQNYQQDKVDKQEIEKGETTQRDEKGESTNE